MTGRAWGRVEKLSRRVSVDVCEVCGHHSNGSRCMPPEEEVLLDATLDEAIQALLNENIRLIHENADLRKNQG